MSGNLDGERGDAGSNSTNVGGTDRRAKADLVRAITQAMIDHAACKPDHLHVIIQDVPEDSWGRAGVLGSEEKES